jgi:hypothetical protein
VWVVSILSFAKLVSVIFVLSFTKLVLVIFILSFARLVWDVSLVQELGFFLETFVDCNFMVAMEVNPSKKNLAPMIV